jgi:hypothetical protein
MARCADDERLAQHSGHEGCPPRACQHAACRRPAAACARCLAAGAGADRGPAFRSIFAEECRPIAQFYSLLLVEGISATRTAMSGKPLWAAGGQTMPVDLQAVPVTWAAGVLGLAAGLGPGRDRFDDRRPAAGAEQLTAALHLADSAAGLTFVALATVAELFAVVWVAARRCARRFRCSRKSRKCAPAPPGRCVGN